MDRAPRFEDDGDGRAWVHFDEDGPPVAGRPMSNGARSALADGDRLEARVAEAAGVLNAAHGALVEAAAAIIAEPWAFLGPGVYTPAAWLAWQAGLSPARARDIERLAKRAAELPCTVAAVVAGELSLEQSTVIARFVPGDYEESACDVAKQCTVRQLRSTLPNYGFDYDMLGKDPKEKKAEERSYSSGTDHQGFWARLRMPAEEGALFEQAFNTKREQLFQAREAEGGDELDPIHGVDVLLAMAESALADMEARVPGTDRYIVNLHLEANPDAPETPEADAAVLWLHQSGGLDRATHRFLTCDAKIRAHLYRDGIPFSSGRAKRIVNRPLRRQVEHRDRGCVIPGCGRLRGLEVHHIRHWEDGGPTVSSNLVCLCRRHHRDHHHGLVAITGNPDLPVGGPDGLAFADATGRPMPPAGTPTTPETGATPAQAARAAGHPEVTYTHPLGERLDTRDFFLQPVDTLANAAHRLPRWIPPANRSSSAADDAASDRDPPPPTPAGNDWDDTGHHPPPGGSTDGDSSTDPTRAGPDNA